MFDRFYLRPNLFNRAIRTNEECHTVRPQIFPTKKALLSPDTIGLHNRFVFIRKQGKGELILVGKFRVGLRGINANSKNHRPFLFEIRKFVAECATFLCAARGIISWIEIEDDGLPSEI